VCRVTPPKRGAAAAKRDAARSDVRLWLRELKFVLNLPTFVYFSIDLTASQNGMSCFLFLILLCEQKESCASLSAVYFQRSSFIPVSCLQFCLTPSIFLNSSFGSTWLTPLCQFLLKKFPFSSSLWRPFQSRYFPYLPQSSEHSSVYFRVISCTLAPV